tara:strand:- start:422 stop:910 length:489 start_codon:yes stop_codon:yes gene_type:complete
MIIKTGDKFPEGTLAFYDSGSLKTIKTDVLFKNKRIVLFGMPGAFTPTCSQYHLPSIIKEMGNFKKKGIDEILCLVVNDVYVASVWSQQTGADEAGLKVVCDPLGTLVKKLGMSFNAPDVGFLDRSIRFCLILNNGTVENIFKETQRGTCAITSGDHISAKI